MRVLVTGGAGYIGSILVARLIENGYKVNVIDDLSTGHLKNVDPKAKVYFGSILNDEVLNAAMQKCKVVFHFAAKSIVSESVENPDLYTKTNLSGTINILNMMKKNKITKILIASTAAVYDGNTNEPLQENSLTAPGNPYGESKLKADIELSNFCRSEGVAGISLRFFNVSAPYKSKSLGWITEEHGPETHLIPNIISSTKSDDFAIYGNDWETRDKTCIRDYLHIKDLTDACILAVKHFKPSVIQIFNLGSNQGTSILEVIQSYEIVFKNKINYTFKGRRQGDVATLIANSNKITNEIGWSIKLGIKDIFEDYKMAINSK
jgi:UDP-glucose 4-epimerase